MSILWGYDGLIIMGSDKDNSNWMNDSDVIHP